MKHEDFSAQAAEELETAERIPTEEVMEDHLQEVIFPQLERGRPNWDEPHTKAVVYHLKRILDNNPELDVDRTVLLIAAYAHDWGYAELFEDGKPAQLDEVKHKKAAHMEIGARKLKELLTDGFFDFLTTEQRVQAVHLVSMHDDMDQIDALDERILWEADTLGALDVSLVRPSFDAESNRRWLKENIPRRRSLFATDYAQKEAERLVAERLEYYEDLAKRKS